MNEILKSPAIITAVIAVINLWLLNWYNKRGERINAAEKAIAEHANREAARNAMIFAEAVRASHKLYRRWAMGWALGFLMNVGLLGWQLASVNPVSRWDVLFISFYVYMLLRCLREVPDLWKYTKLAMLSLEARRVLYEAFRTNSVKPSELSQKPPSTEDNTGK